MKVAKFLAGLVTLRMKIPQMTLKKSFLRKTFRAGCVGVGLFLSSTCIIAQEL